MAALTEETAQQLLEALQGGQGQVTLDAVYGGGPQTRPAGPSSPDEPVPPTQTRPAPPEAPAASQPIDTSTVLLSPMLSQIQGELGKRDQREEDALFNQVGAGGPQLAKGSTQGPPKSLLEQENALKQKFYDDTGYMPPGLKVRHTAQGPVISMGKRDLEKTMRYLKLKETIAQAKLGSQRAEGKDLALERQMKIQAEREDFARAQQEDRQRFAQEQLNERDLLKQQQEERKAKAEQEKRTRASQNTVGLLQSVLSGAKSTPARQALGGFINATSGGPGQAAVPGQGFDPGYLNLARQGITEALGIAGGQSITAAGDYLRLDAREREDIAEYLRQQDQRIAEAQATQATKQRAVDVVRQLGAVPNADVMGILQGLSFPVSGNNPLERPRPLAGADPSEAQALLRDPEAAQYFEPVRTDIGAAIPGYGTGGPTYRQPLRPETAGLVPKNVAAATRLQDLLKGNTPVAQAILALMYGLGNPAQRDRLKMYVQAQSGLDNEDMVVNMVNGDPKWKEIVRGSIDTFRSYRREQAGVIGVKR